MVDRTPLKLTARGFLLYWLPAMAWAGLIFFLSSESEPPQPGTLSNIPGWSSMAHFGLYFVLGAFLFRAAREQRPGNTRDGAGWSNAIGLAFAFSVMAGALYGASDEVHQYFVPQRQTDILDWLVDIFGTAAGAIALASFELRRNKP